MNTMDENQLIQYILNLSKPSLNFEYNKDFIQDLVNNKLEKITRCKIYNKEDLLKEIENLDVKNLDSISTIIMKNMLVVIDFNDMFKSAFNIHFMFNKDEPIVLYENKKLENTEVEFLKIRKNILETKLDLLPPIYNLYLDTLITNIKRIITKDLSIIYFCSNIPPPYLKLFEMKCIKTNKYARDILVKYKYIDDIITGYMYQKLEPDIDEEKSDTELTSMLKEIDDYENKDINNDNYDIYRMEIMAYSNDNEVAYFLDRNEMIEKMDKSDIIKYINLLMESVSKTDNKIMRIYYINLILKYIITIEEFITKHDQLRSIIDKKIDELYEGLYIIQSSEISFGKEVTITFTKAREFINMINKKKNKN
jgi:hypothetical protein